jgi:hypothetical protein
LFTGQIIQLLTKLEPETRLLVSFSHVYLSWSCGSWNHPAPSQTVFVRALLELVYWLRLSFRPVHSVECLAIKKTKNVLFAWYFSQRSNKSEKVTAVLNNTVLDSVADKYLRNFNLLDQVFISKTFTTWQQWNSGFFNTQIISNVSLWEKNISIGPYTDIISQVSQ